LKLSDQANTTLLLNSDTVAVSAVLSRLSREWD